MVHVPDAWDLAAVAEDSLVLWGWHPGGNREPVPVPHDELVAKFKQWAAAGGPCPAAGVGRAVELAASQRGEGAVRRYQ